MNFQTNDDGYVEKVTLTMKRLVKNVVWGDFLSVPKKRMTPECYEASLLLACRVMLLLHCSLLINLIRKKRLGVFSTWGGEPFGKKRYSL